MGYYTHSMGLIFNESYDRLVLIQKNRPDWQKGSLNGIGGKIEEGENEYGCIVRECKEECNLDIKNWLLKGEFVHNKHDWNVAVFFASISDKYIDHHIKTMTDEKILYHPLDVYYDGNYSVLPSTRCAIEICVQAQLFDERMDFFTMTFD